MKKVLITGGPVHAKLDVVKRITNDFKGGMMVDLAERLCDTGVEVVYLTARGVKAPENTCSVCGRCAALHGPMCQGGTWLGGIHVVYHDGFHDYRAKVLEMAKDFDALILGAAVANLIPAKEWSDIYDTKKFPSHDYKVGDIINIPFTIAPHVISEVKAHMKKGAHLFGFKLLKGVPHEELIRAAYLTLMESGATAVFANDRNNLEQKYIVTKERSVIPATFGGDMIPHILRIMEDEYYGTIEMPWIAGGSGLGEATVKVKELIARHREDFVEVGEYKFGCVAWRADRGFATTARGKKEVEKTSCVVGVNNESKTVSILRDGVFGDGSKASLNAPLLARIFEMNGDVHGILHFHRQEPSLTTQAWAPPGTVRDTMRDVRYPFNVEGHGCYLFLDKDGSLVVR